MKISRVIATGAVLALIGGSSVLTTATATAAPVPTTNYVKAADFGTEVSPYAKSWFKGNATPATTVSDSVSGLAVTGQILNGDTPATGLVNLVTVAKFHVVSGSAYFQVPVFANATTGYTTLRPELPGQPTTTGVWITSQAIAADSTNGNGTAYAKGASATLTQFADALGTDVSILAYGAFVNPGTTATISSITWDGVTSQFTPAPTATPATATSTIAQFAKGITVKFTGFVPGDSVQPGIGAGQSGSQFGGPIVADAVGAVTVTFVKSDATVGGVYTLSAFAAGSAITAPFVSVTVVADGTGVATPAAPISGKASFTG